MASCHMEGEALIWFQDASNSGQFTRWDSFVKAIQVRFEPSAYDDSMEALTCLKQTTYVVDYKAQFKAFSSRLKRLSQRHKFRCFLSGLKDEIRLLVRMMNPINLGAAFGLAKIQEEYILSSRNSWKPFVTFFENK